MREADYIKIRKDRRTHRKTHWLNLYHWGILDLVQENSVIGAINAPVSWISGTLRCGEAEVRQALNELVVSGILVRDEDAIWVVEGYDEYGKRWGKNPERAQAKAKREGDKLPPSLALKIGKRYPGIWGILPRPEQNAPMSHVVASCRKLSQGVAQDDSSDPDYTPVGDGGDSHVVSVSETGSDSRPLGENPENVPKSEVFLFPSSQTSTKVDEEKTGIIPSGATSPAKEKPLLHVNTVLTEITWILQELRTDPDLHVPQPPRPRQAELLPGIWREYGPEKIRATLALIFRLMEKGELPNAIIGLIFHEPGCFEHWQCEAEKFGGLRNKDLEAWARKLAADEELTLEHARRRVCAEVDLEYDAEIHSI